MENRKKTSNQEMMGWQDPKITVTMTCCELCTPSHNIVNTGPPTAGASSAACKYHLPSSCKMAAAAPISPTDSLHFCPPTIVIFTIAIGGDDAPVVGCLLLTML
eukprot:scaffold2424_cov62-Cyclotella_meneghiniana.AAC.3